MNVKSILKLFAISAFLMILLLIVGGMIYEKDLGKIVLNQLDEQIHGDLSYDDFSISLFQSFPNIQADFDKLKVNQKNKDIIDADNFAIELDVFKFINKVVKINGIKIASADLHIIRDADGKTNIEALFSSGESDGAAQPIYLEDIELDDVHVRYQDLKSKDEYRLHVDQGRVKAAINERLIKIKATGDGQVDFLTIANLDYAENQTFNLDGDIHIFRSTNLYNFDYVKLKIGKNTGFLTGSMQSLTKGMKYDVELSDVISDLKSLVQTLPDEYAKYITAYHINGRAKGHIRVHGVKDKTTNPFVSITSDLMDGEIQKKNSKDVLKGISGKVTYNNGDKAGLKTSILRVADMRTQWSGQDINTSFVIRDFIDPKSDGSLNGELKLEAFTDYFKNKGIDHIQGSVFVNNLEFKNIHLSDRKSETQGIENLVAKCSLRDINCKIREEKIYISDGELSLADDRMELKNAHALVGVSDFTIDASLDGIISGLLLQKKVANLAAVVESKRIDALQLWKFYKRIKEKGGRSVPVVNTTTYKKEWFEQLRSSLKISAKSMDYNKVHADNVVGTIEQIDRNFKIKTDAQSFSGNVAVESEGRFYPMITADSKIITSGTDVEELFDQFENFDQAFIRSDHLSGEMNLKTHVKCYWDKYGNFEKKRMELDAYFDVRDGRLKDLNILNQFSKYIRVDELGNIKFSKLSNLLEVRNGEVFIPTMFIQNSACNMMLSGYHSIDQRIHYNIKVNAGQVIGNKLRKRKKTYDIVPAQKEGWLNMYFNIDGTIEDFEYEMNKSLVLRGFEFGERKKEEIMSRLTQVFGSLPQFEQPQDWLDIPEYEDDMEMIDSGEEYLRDF